MKRFKASLIIILTFLFSITLFNGCNNSNKKTEDKKGSYIEEDYSMPEDIFNVTDMKKLDNGKIGLLGMTGYKEDSFEIIKLKYYESKDEGKTWSEVDINFPEKNGEKFISYDNGIITKDGNFILNYYEYTSKEIEAENNKIKQNNTGEEDNSYDISKWIILDRDGNKKDIDNSEEIGVCKDVKLDDKESIYFLSYRTNKITKVNLKSGKVENILSLDKEINKFVILKDSLIISNGEEVDKYNVDTLEKEEKIEVLSNNSINLSYFNSEDNETMYLVGSKGVYSYKLGNEILECLINGSKSSLGDSDYNLMKFISIKNDEFLAVFSNSEFNKFYLKHYYFSNDVQAPKKNKITIYSLYKNSNLEQAAKRYQDEHPNIEVEYETPMDSELPENITKDDLIKTLNTEIMAGKGPDIIDFSELPLESYMSKGLLEDISSVIDDSNKEDLFMNIIDDSTKNLYIIPTSFNLPIILNSTSKDIQSLSDLSNNIKSIKEESFQDIIAPIKADEVIYYFARSSLGSLLNDAKSLNKKALKEFLTNIKTIYDESKNVHSEFSIENHKKYEKMFKDSGKEGYLGEWLYYSSVYLTGCEEAFLENSPAINISYMGDADDFRVMYSNKNDYTKFSAWKGMGDNKAEGRSLIGLSSKSKNKEIAKDFIKELLTEEYQEKDLTGIPINKNVLKNKLNELKEELDENFENTFTDAVGNVTKLKGIPLKDEEINEVMSLVEKYNGWSIPNEIINKVIDEMVAYVEGKASMDETITNIEKKLKIYLSE